MRRQLAAPVGCFLLALAGAFATEAGAAQVQIDPRANGVSQNNAAPLLQNASASGQPVAVGGGSYAFSIAGTFNGASVAVQQTYNGVTTTLGTFAAAGSATYSIPAGAAVAAVVTGGPPSGLFATLALNAPGGSAATPSYEAAAAGSFQDGYSVTMGALADAVCSTDTGTCSAQALIKRTNYDLTTIYNKLVSGIGVTGAFWPYTLNGDGGVPSHVTNFPTNAALETGGNLAALVSNEGQDATGVTPPTGGSGVRGWLAGLYNLFANVGAKIVGNVASGSADSGAPVKIGCVAGILGTPVSATQRVDTHCSQYGVLFSQLSDSAGDVVSVAASADATPSSYLGASTLGFNLSYDGSVWDRDRTIQGAIASGLGDKAVAEAPHQVALFSPGAAAGASTLTVSGAKNLYSAYLTNTDTVTHWLWVVNTSTAPANGSFSAGAASGNVQDCVEVAAGQTGSLGGMTIPEPFSVQPYIANSTTGCGAASSTLTLSTVGFLHLLAK